MFKKSLDSQPVKPFMFDGRAIDLDGTSLLYRKYDKNGWIPFEGVLINLHRDMGEMLEVCPETGESHHVFLSAPLEVIRDRVSEMSEQGFLLDSGIMLACKQHALCASEEIQELTDKEDNALMSHIEDMCHC